MCCSEVDSRCFPCCSLATRPIFPELITGNSRIFFRGPMPRRLLRILLILLLLPPLVAAVMGWLVAPSFLHPVRRPLTPDLIREADASFVHSHAHREDFRVTAPDGTE